MPKNHLVLAVAGSRKTQGIVDACAAAPIDERILVLTYTTANQEELRHRLSRQAGDHPHIEVSGWFAFLIGQFVRPFLPMLYRNRRVEGFDFLSKPQRYAKTSDWSRYFNDQNQVRKVHLPQLAILINEASEQLCIRRLERLYDHIFIDEAQDLCGYDLDILQLLMGSSLPLEMVGDIRQAILATNAQEPRNKQFKFTNILNWFIAEQKAGRVTIEQRCETWRCGAGIAKFADTLFDPKWGFAPTVSLNTIRTTHDGVFLVATPDVEAYVAAFSPMVLRHSKSSWTMLNHLDCITFGDAKGLSAKHVLIAPTTAITGFIEKGAPLAASQAARFYVAVTRAEQSVAIITDRPGQSRIPYWSATNPGT